MFRKLREGRGTMKDVEMLTTIIEQMEGNCFCLLGEFVIPGVRTSTTLFKEEYEALAKPENEVEEAQQNLIHLML